MASNQTILLAEALAILRTFSAGTSQDVSVAGRVQYVGSEASGTVTVSSAGDITFQHGDLASEAVDGTIDSGGDDPGVIDVSDANANTLLEVIGLINASPNWRAFAEAGLPDDDMDASTGSILAKSETQAKVAAGLPFYYDGSKTDWGGFAITGHEFKSVNKNIGKVTDGMLTDENVVNLLNYAAIKSGWQTSGVITFVQADQTSSAGEILLTETVGSDDDLDTFNLANPASGFLRAAFGKRLVVRASYGTWDDVARMEGHGTVTDYTGHRTPANP